MGKRMTIPQAVEASGLSEYALRLGIKQGRYPHLRTGGPGKGRILIDIDLLERYLEQEAMDNTRSANDSNTVNYGRLRVIAE